MIAFTQAVEAGRDAVGPDFQFHLEIARATQNPHFSSLLQSLGTGTIPRARLDPSSASTDERQAYLRRVNAEHGSILDAIDGHDGEAARAAMRTHLGEQPRAAPARGPAREQLKRTSYDDCRLRPTRRASTRSARSRSPATTACCST